MTHMEGESLRGKAKEKKVVAMLTKKGYVLECPASPPVKHEVFRIFHMFVDIPHGLVKRSDLD